VGLHIYVDDVDTLSAQAVRAGAELLQPPTDMFYGARSAMLRDPFGHLWVLLTHTDAGVSRNEEAACSCEACRFGRGTDHPTRQPRYTTDTSDAGWQVIEPLMPWPAWLTATADDPRSTAAV
jgi:hypothetical protein